MVKSIKDSLLYFIVSSFSLGIFLASVFKLNIAFVLSVFIICLTLISLSLLKFLNKQLVIYLSVIILFFGFGVFRFYLKDISQNKNNLDNFLEENITINGFISEEVEQRIETQRMIIKADSLFYNGEKYNIEEKILVSTELFPEFSYGDVVSVSGKIRKPENFITDYGKEFDYINYLKKDSIFYTISFADIEKVDFITPNKIKKTTLSIKQFFIDSINKIIPAPESSLLSGILLGVKEGLPKDTEKAFIDTGLIHIIVLSGYNVTIIAESVIKVLSGLSILFGVYSGIIFIFLFCLMAGAGATIVRASIMAIIALFARAFGRPYLAKRSLLIAGFLMVLHNPYVLIYDISFQLSFLATTGLLYLTPVFEKYFKFIPNFIGIREVASSTISVQLFVLPFILYKIGNFSLIAPITNILVLPFIPITMFFGFIASFIGIFSYIFAVPFGFITYILLKIEIYIVELFNKIPFASFSIEKFPLIVLLIMYIFIFYFIIKNNENKV